jgi:fucose 4-O-acetylase-like acetyltransferase
MSISKRIEYIDIARGIGILLVVMGHNDFAAISPFGHKLIYSFHMPLFFFLSGYFFKTAMGFWDFFKKRFNAIMKPYFFTIFLIYFFSISFGKMGFQTALTRIVKSLYGAGHYLDWVQLWFLPHLFVVSLYAFLFYVVMSRVDNRWIRWIVLLLTLGLASVFLTTFYPYSFSILGKNYELFGLPFSLDLVLLSGFFFILGSEARHVTSESLFSNLFFLIGTGVLMIVLNLVFPARIDFNTRVYDSFVINTIEAIIGILFVLALSRQIELHTHWLASFFKYCGKISLILLLFHVPIQDFWGQKIRAVTDNVPLSIWLAFFMGVLGPIILYELFIKTNPVASFWFGREAELPKTGEEAIPADVMNPEENQQPVVNQ